MRTPGGIGYGPRSDSSAYSNVTVLLRCALPTTVIGMPIGPPSQRPEPKSACIVFVAPIAATVAPDPAATGRVSTRRFHALSAGKRGHAFAGGSGDPQAAVAAIVATTAATRAMILTVKVSASGDRLLIPRSEGASSRDSARARRRRTRRGGRRSPRSWISSTFSAFRSPEREKLNDPTKTTSSATTTFACMKSCSDSGVQRVDGLPENGAPVEDRAQKRDLPRADAVRRPLVEDLVDLRLVDHAGDVAAALVHDLDERAEDRARREHGRRDPDPASRSSEELRHAVGERVAVLGREPGADLRLPRRRSRAAARRDPCARPCPCSRARRG